MTNSFIAKINKLANELETHLTELENIKNTVLEAKQTVNQAKTEALQASTSAQSNANTITAQLNREATNNLLGSVKLATDNDITQGVANKVITADKLKYKLDNISNNLNLATETTKGLVKIATQEEITNGTGNNVLTPENIKHMPITLNLTDYYTHQVIGSINFVILKINETVSYLHGFGRIITVNTNTTKVVFPKPILTQHIGINFGLIGLNNKINNKAIINEITRDYCTVSIVDKDNNLVSDTGSFTMQALVDNEVTPTAPVDVKVTATGDNVTIGWQD